MPQRHELVAPVPVRGVLFDLHSTLIDQGDARDWLDAALARQPRDLKNDERVALADWLDRIWERARVLDPESLRDLSPTDHYRVFHELLADGPGVDPALGDALHAVLLEPWRAYDDAIPTLRALRADGIAVAGISNAGVDIESVLEREGLSECFDAVVLSKDIGVTKPDPTIFLAALEAIECTPASGLMVGDSGKDDAGATVLGLRTIILPRTRGTVHGLEAVVHFVRATQSLG